MHSQSSSYYLGSGRTEAERANQHTQGRSKREWVQLEERAAHDQKDFGDKARLRDEEAVDAVLDEDPIRK